MKNWIKLLWCLILLISLPMAAESLVAGNAYIISSINVKPNEAIDSGKEYSLVPQIVVYEEGKEYVGSVTKFSGCYNGKLYDQSEEIGVCFLGGNASSSDSGLMSASDKAKLDSIDVASLIKYKNFGSNVFGADLTANQGAGIVVKDESTGTNWNIHMHGGQLRLWDGATEKVLQDNSNVVTLYDNQTIGSLKSFSNYIRSVGPNLSIEGGLPKISGTQQTGSIWGSNGISFSNPGTQNDAGWVRVLGSDENNTLLEIGTGDDGASDFNIAFRAYDTSNNVVYDVRVPKISGTLITDSNVGSYTVNRSNSSGWADAAWRSERMLINGATSEGVFHWSGQGGQPTWLWGSNDGTNMYVWNPSNFSVNYANSSNTSNYSNSSGSSDYANRVWTQSHNGSWYINSNWNGSYFVTNARENGAGELPILVSRADSSGWADNSGWANSAGNADTVDGYHASDLGKFYGIGGLLAGDSNWAWRSITYTAPQNAWFTIEVSNGNPNIRIDGVTVGGDQWAGDGINRNYFYPLKAGQTIYVNNSYNYWRCFAAS